MYGKVFEQIFDSSIAEDWKTRVVFEDFLILADQNGVVDKTPESISRRTNVPLEIIQDAIKKLEAPDLRSRRKEHEGRRIARLDDHRDWGWLIVNYEYYRKLASEEQRRQKTKERVERFREKKEDVTPCNASVTHGNDSPYTSTSASVSSSDIKKGGCKGEFELFWKAYPKKVAKASALKAWRHIKHKPDVQTIIKSVEAQKLSEQWTKDVGQFIPYPATWLNAGRWEDSIDVEVNKPKYTTLDEIRAQRKIEEAENADNLV